MRFSDTISSALRSTGIYPILDLDCLKRVGCSLGDFAAAVLSARPALIQFRAKSASPREALECLRRLQPMCRAQGVLLFANDRPDLAVAAGCDGVHVGQDDLPIDAVRAFAPTLLLGVSTHSQVQFERALTEAPDYIAFGPVYPTESKQNPEPTTGLAALRTLSKIEGQRVPIVAIGGIGLRNARALAELGVMGATIAALLPESLCEGPGWAREVEAKACALQAALCGEAEARPGASC